MEILQQLLAALLSLFWGFEHQEGVFSAAVFNPRIYSRDS